MTANHVFSVCVCVCVCVALARAETDPVTDQARHSCSITTCLEQDEDSEDVTEKNLVGENCLLLTSSLACVSA